MLKICTFRNLWSYCINLNFVSFVFVMLIRARCVIFEIYHVMPPVGFCALSNVPSGRLCSFHLNINYQIVYNFKTQGNYNVLNG